MAVLLNAAREFYPGNSILASFSLPPVLKWSMVLTLADSICNAA
jgi:hypothetical protein